MKNPVTLRLIAVLIVLVTAGCTASYRGAGGDGAAAYARTPGCCDDPAEFAFTSLPDRGRVSATIDERSQQFDFQSGVSPFAAFALPESGSGYHLRIKSLFDTRRGASSVFYPVVALLDDTFIVVRMSGLEGLRLDSGLTRPEGEPGLAVTLPIDPASERGKYIVVFTPAALLDAAPRERRDGDLLTPSVRAWLARGEPRVPASPYGRLEILVAPEMTARRTP